MEIVQLNSKAAEIRRKILKMITHARGGHLGASLSEADILTTLFFHTLRLSPENADDPGRDRFVLSKGHASEGLYCTLAERGFFPETWLDDYLKPDCPLTTHPTNHIPGVEANTGALGHGFSIAVGMALGAKKAGRSCRVFVLTGDGELQEGSNWEAAMAAAHFKLGNLTWIIDHNGLQLAAPVRDTMGIEPLEDKLRAFGFDTHHVDGNSAEKVAALLDSLDYDGGVPHAVIAKTIKGKGVSFMENVPEWHHRIPTEEECTKALRELVL
ncbi:MAG: transketolase [Spirochaetaceae bacterium]|nr:transketolase [Spirochaetaceae bacterium]